MYDLDHEFDDARQRAFVFAGFLAMFIYFGSHAAGAYHGTFGIEPSSLLVAFPPILAVLWRPTTPVFVITLLISMRFPWFFDRPLSTPVAPSDVAGWWAAIFFFLFARFHSRLFFSGAKRRRYVDFLLEGASLRPRRRAVKGVTAQTLVQRDRGDGADSYSYYTPERGSLMPPLLSDRTSALPGWLIPSSDAPLEIAPLFDDPMPDPYLDRYDSFDSDQSWND